MLFSVITDSDGGSRIMSESKMRRLLFDFCVVGLVILLKFGEATISLDDFFCNSDEQYNTCCQSSAVVSKTAVKVDYSSGTNNGNVEVRITWQPVEHPSPIQYEILLMETSAGGSCNDLIMMPNPCDPFKGGILVDDPSFTAGNISFDSNYICRIRVLSSGIPSGLSICLDSEDIDPRRLIPEFAAQGDRPTRPDKVLSPRLLRQWMFSNIPEENRAELNRVRRQDRGSVRLADGSAAAGRVEVYLGGQWGTVCDSSWSMEDADVVCRELGFSAAISAPGGAYFGEGGGLIQMGNVSCTGTETRLVDCDATYFGANCSHSKDAGVVCEDIEDPACGPKHFECNDGTCIPHHTVCDDDRNCDDGEDEKVCTRERGSIRLVDGNATAGRVEIYLGGQWGTVCDNNWSMEDADVVCRENGFSGAISAPGGAYFGEGKGLVQMTNVACSGFEIHLVLCPYTFSDCSHSEDAGVVCEDKEHGSIQLVNGNVAAGRVEVYLDGQWGTVCDNNWGMEDADVVCRELGFSAAISAPGGAYFGEGKGLIQMKNVACNGTELHLVQCPYTSSDCSHSEDAGVICEDKAKDTSEDQGNSDPEVVSQWLMGIGSVVGSVGLVLSGVAGFCCFRK